MTSNDASVGEDRGPYCLGVPLLERRTLTTEDRRRLRRLCLRYCFGAAALLLPLPLWAVGYVWFYQSEPILACVCVALFGPILLLGVLILDDSPILRGFATFRDLRAGYIECYAGRFYLEECEHAAHLAALYGEESPIGKLMREVKMLSDRRQELERLPRSGCIWSINQRQLLTWATAPIEGIAESSRPCTPYTPPAYVWPWDGDYGFFFACCALLCGILGYEFLRVPLIGTPFVVLGVWSVIARNRWG